VELSNSYAYDSSNVLDGLNVVSNALAGGITNADEILDYFNVIQNYA
jgi:hypothetical protein